MEITDLIAVSDRPGAEFINDAETVRYGTYVLAGTMLCDTAHVLMLFHGALHAGDRPGHCLDTADRGSVYGCGIVSDLFPDPETGRLAGHNLKIDFTGVIPVFSL